jgi:RNA polymerase sigma-70 factor (ECF subfamily)
VGQSDHSTGIQRLLDLVRAGDGAARDELIRHSFERLRRLARWMFHRRPLLRAVVETDDVLQNAAVRLYRALPEVMPDTVGRFLSLAAQQVRRELIDLARRHLGKEGAKARRVVSLAGSGSGSHHHVLQDQAAASAEPEDLVEWAEFHLAVDRLPDKEREAVHLLLYQGMEQADAALLMQVSVRQVKRLWRSAKSLLEHAVHGDWPKL